MMRFYRLLWLLALPGLLWMSSCAEGETVPLIPAGPICEYPLDSEWQYFTNICREKDPLDAVWPSGQMPVIVGSRGLILECTAESQWSIIDLPIQENLNVIVANDDGDLVAAGNYGALAVRKDGQWETLDFQTDTNWRDVRSFGREVWLAGDKGTLARGIPGETWTLVDYPDTSDLLAVCAVDDSVFVGNANGELKVLVDGHWGDCSFPGQWGVQSIVRTDDGRLMVWSSSLWERTPDGWINVDAPFYLGGFSHLKLRDNYLWIPSHHEIRLDLSTEPMQVRFFNGHGNGTVLAPGPVDEAFNTGSDGVFTWLHDEGAESVSRRWDTAGRLFMRKLTRFADGAVVFPSPDALFTITPEGVSQVRSLTPEIEESLESDTSLTGTSLDDFYLVESMKVQHILNGTVSTEIDLPGDMGGIRNFRVNEAGQICVAFWRGVLFREANEWETWTDESYPWVTLTQQNNFVITWNPGALYQSAEGLIPINTEMPSVLVKESEPGVLDFMSHDYRHVQWRLETGIEGFTYLDPLPGCNELIYRTIAETPLGFLLAGHNNSMVLRIPDNPYHADWELVAGPCKYEISSLETLDDGSLVAVCRGETIIAIYPSGNF